MSIPNYYDFYRDVLDVLEDGKTHQMKDIRSIIAKQRNFTLEELNELLPSGNQTVFASRTSWAVTYLRAAGLVERPMRGNVKLTQEGRRVQQDTSFTLDDNYLMRYPAFAAYKNPTQSKPESTADAGSTAPATAATAPSVPAAPAAQAASVSSAATPQETIHTAYQQLKSALAQQLLEEILARDPDFFERLVVKLLRNMGYGGPFEDAFQVTQRSNDGGIDGIIKEDPLGFSKIYIQAKRWNPSITIGRPEIQKFCGALQDAGAHKGLFITTANFSVGAIESASRQHIVLVDGPLLTRLMIEYDLGVSTTQTYSIKEVDHDFFDED